MKKQILIKTKSKKCKIVIENGSINTYLKSELRTDSKKFIIIDSKVSKKIDKIIKNKKNVFLVTVKGSEKLKSISSYWKIISKLLQKKIDRSSTLISIGGGTVGDLCGFISNTILRGVKFSLIPTTLLSQVDSSIGGKNGINSKYGKNLIGTFYQPDIVIIDPTILRSLPLKQLRTGYAEIVKYALINDKNFFIWLKKNLKDILLLKKNQLNYAILKSIKIKEKYVINDEKEKLVNSSSRAMLNFGHTFGHALELINKYHSNLTHGEAISIGMILAAKISYRMKNIRRSELDDIIYHFKQAGLPYSTKSVINNKLYKAISADKKNTNNKINLILLKKVGEAYYKRGLNITELKNLIN
ncbi:MAG: 3-dehydroquinate synthase [Pelagibacteraceae bacterium]|jgi:3-dehydroquinate synthase/shikimate kinase/3-dehydroquinate synthase|nr:3-dehydroquinate synthase [Pelagibacteraceae bacterium]HJO13507.1 3-dehydroquinate synthase [Alphaproteobacteria bacterium]MBO6466838.1 3-dehydroquinate synthase [Pelagibacteraceae bacterium]MBO6467150.1 3-dehydroquinate synthase [Pelagibacteraceae bacterium]MBO6470060.1 3-dehydroquinate synthase [Pelagibacteraceae bacterium]|tara:strand:- start:15 stop:1085 length:1071 start_codon:yes stop_codon:yes gene_type:complete